MMPASPTDTATAPVSVTREPLLTMRGIHKSFSGVHTLQGVDLELHDGEVLALLGENGAGKSTLMRILGGACRMDAGSIRIGGEEMHIANPSDACAAGVAMIYQEFNLVPGLSVRENIFLGREHSRAGFIARRDEARLVRELLTRLGLQLDPEARCSDLTVAQQQIVEIAKALFVKARIVIMDEPTAALTDQETTRLFAIIRELRAQGLGIIYISHRLDEIFMLADRISVLRDGQMVGTCRLADVTRERLIEMMVGRQLKDEFPARHHQVGTPRLVVTNLGDGRKVRDVSFTVHAGEVLALTGLVGGGRTEVARMLFGADPRATGDLSLDGQNLSIASPRDAIRAGIGLLTEDRKNQGLLLNLSVQDNFSLPNLARFARWGWISHSSELTALHHWIGLLRIKLNDDGEPVRNLSGGNQQKVVLAKWLLRDCSVMIFDEPTRGIDVGAKYEIYQFIDELARQGKAILLISSELPEVLGVSDRILVMHEGRITGEIRDVARATQEQIMGLAVK